MKFFQIWLLITFVLATFWSFEDKEKKKPILFFIVSGVLYLASYIINTIV